MYRPTPSCRGCRAIIEEKVGGWFEGFAAGQCFGITQRLAWTRGPQIGIFCPPDGATHGQMLRVVVRYIEEHPQDMHEAFALLAYRALHEVWPCTPKADK
jgi:Rap1a immunity proteins